MLNFAFILDNWLFIVGGLGETLLVSILSILLAIPIALIVGYGRRSSSPPLAIVSTLYVSAIEATPLILQIFFVFLALPQVGIFLPGLLAGALMLGVNSSARMSEIFRLWLAPTEEGGRKPWRSLIPSVDNELIAIVKDSALLSITGFLHDIMWRATKVGRAEFHNLEALLIALLVYWGIIIIISIPKMIPSLTARPAK